MPEIEELPSSDDEEEVVAEQKPVQDDKATPQRVDPAVVHPASFGEEIPERFLETMVNHPGCVRVVKKDAKEASRLKELGNEKFRAGELDLAIEFYSDALDFCPDEDEFKYSAAVFLSNRAACFLKLGQYEDVLDDCTDALELDPRYVKALMRRSQAHEAMGDLDAALADMNRVLEIDSSIREAVKEQARLDAAVKKKHEALKEEMMGKLKDLGNTVLGKFGFSLDNFKTVQDPNTGSYSISFQQ